MDSHRADALEPNVIKAPWTEEQFASLRDYQACGYMHEFTSESGAALIPTVDGWVEVEGGPVVQDWAHAFMLDGSWARLPSLNTGMPTAAAPQGHVFGWVLPAQQPCPTCGKPMAIGWPYAWVDRVIDTSVAPAWRHSCSWCDDDRTKAWRAALEAIADGACTADWCCGKTCQRGNGSRRPELGDREPCATCRARIVLGRPKPDVEPAAAPLLFAWSNHYEVVAATSEHEAREILRKGGDGGPAAGSYDDEELDGDGWHVLPNAMEVRDDDGIAIVTVGDIVREKGRPGHLWSIDR